MYGYQHKIRISSLNIKSSDIVLAMKMHYMKNSKIINVVLEVDGVIVVSNSMAYETRRFNIAFTRTPQ